VIELGAEFDTCQTKQGNGRHDKSAKQADDRPMRAGRFAHLFCAAYDGDVDDAVIEVGRQHVVMLTLSFVDNDPIRTSVRAGYLGRL
jgi:hypothetical protein